MTYSVCAGCAALVADPSLHAGWHARQAAWSAPGEAVTVAPDRAWPQGVPLVVLPEPDGRVVADRAILDALAALPGVEHPDGDPWVQPSDILNAYPMGAIVTHGGRRWRSRIPFNVFQPASMPDPQAFRWWDDITPPAQPI